jgi:hypothetical protein
MSPRLTALVPGLVLLLCGCRDREITSYRAPKDPAPVAANAGMAAGPGSMPEGHPPVGAGATPAAGGMAGTAVPTGSDSLTWTAPAAWTAMPERPMRKATFAVKDAAGATADLSITAFPGDTGGLLANLNRWRGQIALPPLNEPQLPASVEHLEANGLHLDVVDFVGTANGAPTRIVGAVVPKDGETWFFKLMGPDALVAAQKPAFLDFLRTVRSR